MSRRLQLAIILAVVIVISAIVSHGVVVWLKIATTSGSRHVVGHEDARSSIFMAGSSLAGDGLAWGQISDVLNWRIEYWTVPGSSTCEWESFQHLPKQTKMMVLVVSAYDQNEYSLSDFRADVVPLWQTVKDLRQSEAEWPYRKRLLSLYPLTYLRKLFPTSGRSDGVMVGAREKLKSLLRSEESEAGPTMFSNGTSSIPENKLEKVSDWPRARLLRRLASIRSGCQGRHTFNGPKRVAFLRMLSRAQEQGQSIVVVVLPISPIYANEFLTEESKREYEESMIEAQKNVPLAHWIRLDHVAELNSNEYFWDLVHMNSYGQKIATKAFLSLLQAYKGQL